MITDYVGHTVLLKNLQTNSIKQVNIISETITSIKIKTNKYGEVWIHKPDFIKQYIILEDLGETKEE